ncbi:hypothetical protein CIK05_00480 [Bdellovibrio sp. qaytius]|nr:hypothetical protein CIK05_00480 [Bdellovibrio sp. qaytius]
MVSHLNWLNVLILSLFLSLQTFATTKTLPKVSFTSQKITIGAKKITVDIAKTHEQQEHGLMYREKMPVDAGMLFIFEQDQPLNFWMKNTYIDLSIAYIGKDKKIIDILDMKATSAMQTDYPTYPSSKPAMYALEMNQGWFTKNHIKIGDLLVLPRSK